MLHIHRPTFLWHDLQACVAVLAAAVGDASAKFDFPLHTVQTYHHAITMQPAPGDAKGEPVTWYHDIFTAEKDYTVDGVKLKAGESISGIGPGDWTHLEGSKLEAAARYNDTSSGAGSGSVQSSWNRYTAQQAQTHWNNQLCNDERDRSFDAVRRAAGYPSRN